MIFVRIIMLCAVGLGIFCAVIIEITGLVGGHVHSEDIMYQSKQDGESDIYITDMDRGFVVNLTHDPYQNAHPAWSPDGSQIAFTGLQDGIWQLYVMDVDGRDKTRLTSGSASHSYPSWSPDGSEILYVSDEDGDWDLYQIDVDAKNHEPITYNDYDEMYAIWSPDGEQIAFTSQQSGMRDVYLMQRDGENIQRLTEDAAVDTAVHWSPDGEHLIWLSERDPDRDQCSGRIGVSTQCIIHVNIFTMTVSGTNVQRLTTRSGAYWSPVWSSDGEWILYAHAADRRRNEWGIYLMRKDGSEIQRLLDGSFPAWRPS